MQTADWLSILTSIGNIGFSVVVAWYLLSKAIPAMQTRFSSDLKAQQDIFSALLREQREDYKAALAADKNAFETMLTIFRKEDSEVLKRSAEETHLTYKMLEDYVRSKGKL
jgi:hypothetical protein